MRKKFFEEAYLLYAAFLEEKEEAVVPRRYLKIAADVMKKIGWKTKLRGVDFDFEVKKPEENNRVLLALSGGLDSVYLLHKLKDAGYEVIAVHVSGLNKSSAKAEAECAEAIARQAGAKYISIKFNSPQQHFPDNPFKNQLILSMMLDYGTLHGCQQYAIGSDWTTPLREAVTGFTITDSAEVYREYWKGVKEHFPSAELVFINDTEKKYDRLIYLYKNHPKELELVSSCISPNRFREYRRKQNIEKYNIQLMPKRCGSCYKCSMEYILLVEAGLIEKNKKYYEHCLDILATSKTSHRPDLFDKRLSIEKRIENLKNYGS